MLFRSVRDTVFNELEIHKDDYLAVSDGEIKGVGKNRIEIILKAIENTLDSDSEILSIYYGADVTEDEANEIAEKIEGKYPELEIDVYSGGQPIYYFVFSIE